MADIWDEIEARNDAKFGAGKWHCDDILTQRAAPECVLAFLRVERSPGHGFDVVNDRPQLFARYKGRRVKVVMASRFGDVGITRNLTAEFGYTTRVYLPELTDFDTKA